MVSIVGVGLSLSIPLLSLEMERMGVSSVMIGVNTATAGLAAIVTLPFVPRLAARLGVGRLIAASIALSALSLLAFKAVPWLPAWFLFRFVYSAALGALFVLSEFWINTAAPASRRGFFMGLYATVLSLGFAAGPAVLVMVGTTGWAPYAIGALLFGVAAIPLAGARGETPMLETHSRHGTLFFVLAAPAATVAVLVFGAVETGGFSLLPIYGLRLGFGPADAAFLVSLVALGSVLLQIPIGLLSDRMNRRVLLLAVGLVGTLATGLLPWAAGTPLLFEALLVIWGGIGTALYTVGLAHLGERFSAPEDLAGANAAFILLYNVGLMVGPPLVGFGMHLMMPHGFAVTLALLFALYVLVAGVRLGVASR
ncbi:MFS transporter [Chelatococcus reniformis]|uniref:MFS transporter n=2 Tax=Chelatococcus reniformis TaxID=1494448 RepID=A0A916U258_9HYPH|nr:MFS transporter [Chelatococcus reniformis]